MITTPTFTAEIKDYASLQESIRLLKAQKLHQEAMLRAEITAIIDSVNPVEMVKDSLHNLVSDKSIQLDLVKMGLNLSAELLTARLFGRYRSIPVFLGMKVVQKVAGFFLKDKISKSDAVIIKLLSPGSASISEEENTIT
ncbi:MAG: hypothetical protein Q7V19_15320 [Bacteroidales bacterium]|nr:hypothetical protein [Bacteroidales bacterium]